MILLFSYLFLLTTIYFYIKWYNINSLLHEFYTTCISTTLGLSIYYYINNVYHYLSYEEIVKYVGNNGNNKYTYSILIYACLMITYETYHILFIKNKGKSIKTTIFDPILVHHFACYGTFLYSLFNPMSNIIGQMITYQAELTNIFMLCFFLSKHVENKIAKNTLKLSFIIGFTFRFLFFNYCLLLSQYFSPEYMFVETITFYIIYCCNLFWFCKMIKHLLGK